jgi:7,8-dihydro-6-hydroxymethylpterin dimethyltransferase
MDSIQGSTQSLCPVCLKVIPAYRVARKGDLYLEKECPQHGKFSALIWRDADSYESWGASSVEAVPPSNHKTPVAQGCPYDCGLCTDHQAQTCTAIIEVTQRCNLVCPVCFASSTANGKPDPSIDTIERMFRAVWDYAGNPSIQLSGGEPTIRNDLPEIIALGKSVGFSHIQINTNGLRIVNDFAYLAKLVDAGADLIYLQFDGVDDSVYRILRGRDLFQLKVQAVNNCAKARIGVLLVPTIVPGCNQDQLGGIVEFAKRWIPIVKGIHFQPISYFGRYPTQPDDKDRFTLTDVIHSLVEQTSGELKETNFLPRRSKDAHCSFNSIYVLGDDGSLRGRTNIGYVTISEQLELSPALLVRDFVNTRWRLTENIPVYHQSSCCGSSRSKYLETLEEEKKKSITITCMPFQDVWNIDLDRLKKCCVHVVTEQGSLVPFCAYYLTNISGERLY